MRFIVTWFPLAALVGCLVMMWSEHRVLAQQRTPVTLTRIFTGSDGQTHAEKVDVRLEPVPNGAMSATVKVTSAFFMRLSPGYFQDWHPARERRYVITLSGRGEVELTGGQKILLEPGRVLQAEDLTGMGHITRTVGNEDWTALFVQLEK